MKSNFKEYAEYYYRLGLNMTCITNTKNPFNANSKRYKSPSHSTIELYKNRQTYDELLSYSWDDSIGVGTLCGTKFSDGTKEYDLIVLDFDGISLSQLEVVVKFLRLPSNYEWVVQTGSKLGYHIYFFIKNDLFHYTDKLVLSYRKTQLGEPPIYFERCEVLLNCHCVLPPSFHASTFNYSFIYCELPNSLPDIVDEDRLIAFLADACDNRDYPILSQVYFPAPYNFKNENFNNLCQVDIRFEEIKSIVLDIETDGLIENNNYPNILQIAWYCLDKWNNIIKTEVFAIKNIVKLNAAYNINNLDIDTLNKVGYEFEDVLKCLYKYLKFSTKAICYNKTFDLNVINYYLKKNGYDIKFDIEESYCVMENYAQNKKLERYISLENAYEKSIYHKINVSHNAETDVFKTYQLYRYLNSK